MQHPLQITFHELPPSDAVARYVRRHAEKLHTFYDRIIFVRVAIEAPHRHKREGRPYRVCIVVDVPGEEIVVSRDVGGFAHEDVYATIDVAFDDVVRRLEDHAKVIRGEVKRHTRAQHGYVSKLFTYEGYGFIATEDGDEIYFHRNSVLNRGFERMRRGDKVRFTDAEGDDGIHASTVVLLPRHRREDMVMRYR